MQYSYIIPLYLISALVCFLGSALIHRQLRLVVAAGSAARVLLIMGAWAFLGALESMLTTQDRKLLLTNIAYVAYTMLIPSWVQFMVEYTTRRTQGNNVLVVALYSLFGVFAVLNWINPGNLFYTSIAMTNLGGIAVLTPVYGPIFWVYTACAYAATAAMLLWLIFAGGKKKIRRSHMVIMAAAVCVPILCNIPYVFKWVPYDITAIGFIGSALMLFILYQDAFFADMPLSRRNIIDAMGDGIILVDGNRQVMEMNGAAKDMLCVNDEESDWAQRASEAISTWPLHMDKASCRFVQPTIHPVHGLRYYRISSSSIKVDKREMDHFLLVLQDETTLHTVQERVQYLECYDEATGLYNRQYFLQLLEQEIERCQLLPQTIALVSASLNNFREYCYLYGNEFGQELIQAIGGIIKGVLRRNDAISCFSDNEFFFYLRFENSNIMTNTEQIDGAMSRIYEQLRKPITIGDVTLEVKLRAGIALCPKHSTDSAKLINLAYVTRRNVANHLNKPYSIFKEGPGVDYNRSLTLEHSLHKALERNELYLVYQPQIDLRDQHVVGVEALLRWSHPELGLVPPNEFIPIAEENGLIHSIGFFVIEEVIKQIAAWQALGQREIRVSANVSINQLTNSLFSSKVLELLEKTGIDPKCLELEVTESLALFPEALTYGHLQKLREKGVRIAMDDFGMGHSSLSYIKEFEVDTIKIDRMVTKDILNDHVSVAMMKSVKLLCESLGTDMVVECIEHQEQLRILEEMGCYVVQGYVYSPPLLVEACTKYILAANEAATLS